MSKHDGQASRAGGVVERRGFLKAVTTGAAGAALAAPLLAAGPAAAKESAEERVKARYRETDHVKAYYRTNRY